MFEATRQKVLLVLALVLLGAVVLDQVVVSPLWGYLSEVDLRIEQLSADIDEARRQSQALPPGREGAEVLRRRLRRSSGQAQNEFRRYLEAQLAAGAEITSSEQVSAVALTEAPDVQRITYDLVVFAPQDALRRTLENLDASGELLCVEKLQVSRAGADETRLKATMLVSVLASSSAPAAAQPAFGPPAGAPPAALAANMFFPGPAVAAGQPAGQGRSDEFVLAGIVISTRRRAALLEFPASGQIRWVGLGDRAGEMTIADVRRDAVVFRLGGQEVALAVGRPGTDLLAGRRVLGGGFELIGVCHAGSRRFAMIQPDAGGRAQRVHVQDRLGPGVIAQISDDGIVLDVAGARHAVPVGGRFTGRADLR